MLRSWHERTILNENQVFMTICWHRCDDVLLCNSVP